MMEKLSEIRQEPPGRKVLELGQMENKKGKKWNLGPDPQERQRNGVPVYKGEEDYVTYLHLKSKYSRGVSWERLSPAQPNQRAA